MFEFGFAKEDITPVYGIPLCGYFNPRPNKGVLDSLLVNTAVFRYGGVTTGIVSYDLCFIPYVFVERIIKALKAKKIPFAEKLLFAVTHMHTGPYPATRFDDFSDPNIWIRWFRKL